MTDDDSTAQHTGGGGWERGDVSTRTNARDSPCQTTTRDVMSCWPVIDVAPAKGLAWVRKQDRGFRGEKEKQRDNDGSSAVRFRVGWSGGFDLHKVAAGGEWAGC